MCDQEQKLAQTLPVCDHEKLLLALLRLVSRILSASDHLEPDAEHDQSASQLERGEGDPEGIEDRGPAPDRSDENQRDADGHLDRRAELEGGRQVTGHRNEDPRVADGIHHREKREKRLQEGDGQHAEMILDRT